MLIQKPSACLFASIPNKCFRLGFYSFAVSGQKSIVLGTDLWHFYWTSEMCDEFVEMMGRASWFLFAGFRQKKWHLVMHSIFI